MKKLYTTEKQGSLNQSQNSPTIVNDKKIQTRSMMRALNCPEER